MDGQFNSNPFVSEQEEPETAPESWVGLPFYGGKSTTISSPKRRKGAAEKRVVSVPIGEVEGSKGKGEGVPPSDSWAWRKYGQKPIKGSPYPRGYYRCSSSKGCPARKQVERSRVDPTMLLITYAGDHNHPKNPTPTNPHLTPTPPTSPHNKPAVFFSGPADVEPDDTFPDLEPDAATFHADVDFCWLSDVASSPAKDPLLLDSPICAGTDAEVASAVLFPMGEEDELLFGDLGELPECSVVFRRCSLREAPWCGSPG